MGWLSGLLSRLFNTVREEGILSFPKDLDYKDDVRYSGIQAVKMDVSAIANVIACRLNEARDYVFTQIHN